jgi:hypothetical protein
LATFAANNSAYFRAAAWHARFFDAPKRDAVPLQFFDPHVAVNLEI